MPATVCILAAGSGTRMGAWGSTTNKALLPLEQKAALTHIIEKFPSDTRFVLALGYHSAYVREYVSLAHPQLSVDFVEVHPYAGPGSGPGASLFACRAQLAGPFFVVCADTLWSEEIPLAAATNWVAVAPVPGKETAAYCVVEADGKRALALHDKKALDPSRAHFAFTGLFYVHENEEFFRGLRLRESIKGEHQLSEGLAHLLELGRLETRPLPTWRDVGTWEKYEAARESGFDRKKAGELFYSVGGRIIKFYEDASIVKQRVARSRASHGKFPPILAATKHHFAYERIEGTDLYDTHPRPAMSELLAWFDEHLWDRAPVDPAAFSQACREFYREKTGLRLDAFRALHPNDDLYVSVNEESAEPLDNLLPRVPWEELARGEPRFIHGDLHFGNIIASRNGTLHLIDWRQNFGGLTTSGDLYYELAKLLAGTTVDYRRVERDDFSFRAQDGRVDFFLPPSETCAADAAAIESYCRSRGLDYSRVRILTALVFLNMAPLHAAPFSRALFQLGKQVLQRALAEKKSIYVA